MKTYFSELIPRISNFSKKLDDLSLLTNRSWIFFDPSKDATETYIFLGNKELLLSVSGNVKKGKWDLVTNQKLLIDIDNTSLLFNLGFLNDKILALNINFDNNYVIFIEEKAFSQSIRSIEDVHNLLSRKSLEPKQVYPTSFNVNRTPVKKTSILLSTIYAILLLAFMSFLAYLISTFAETL